MKKIMSIIASGLVMGSTALALASIEGSKHDLSSGGYNGGPLGDDGQDRICVYCHHPHNTVKAGSGLVYSPLWNREYRTGGGRTFVAYNNGTNMGDSSSSRHMMNGSVEVGGVSLLCMSCHDGQTAMNAYSDTNPAGPTGSEIDGHASYPVDNITTMAAFGFDLANHHPVGMNWDEVTLNDPEISDKSETFRNSDIRIADVLTGGETMECSSCHDVHNSGNQMLSGAFPERFLWTSDDHSDLCLSCHRK